MPPIAVSQASVCRRVIADASSDPAVNMVSNGHGGGSEQVELERRFDDEWEADDECGGTVEERADAIERARGQDRGRQPRQAVEEPHGHTNRGRPRAGVGQRTQQERAAEDDERAASAVVSRRPSTCKPAVDRGFGLAEASAHAGGFTLEALPPLERARGVPPRTRAEVSAEIWSSSVVIGGMRRPPRRRDRRVRPTADSTQLGRVQRPGWAYTARGWIAARPNGPHHSHRMALCRSGVLVCLRRAGPPRLDTPGPRDRASHLDMLLGVGFVSTALSFVYPLWRYLIPPAVAEATTNSVVAGKVTAFKNGSGTIVKFGSKPAILVRTAEGEFRAFSAVCTHLDCTVFSRHVAALVRVSQRPLRPGRQQRLRTAAPPARVLHGEPGRARAGRRRGQQGLTRLRSPP